MSIGSTTHAGPRGRRPARRLLIVALLVIAFTGALPAEAATCFQTTCAGKNPSTAGCAATTTPRELFFDDRYTLQLRYSAGCYAFWGRIVRDDCSLIQGMAWLKVERQLSSPYGWYTTHRYFRLQSSVPCNGGVGYTAMVPNSTPSDDRFRACWSNYITTFSQQSSIPASSWRCTTWHQF
jgi:hypothetical protein